MARRLRILFDGAIYHVTFRGNNRQSIFEDIHDRKRMVERLADTSELLGVRVYLFCLMPNHVHLLLETPMGNLDRFMASLLTGYTKYFNIRHHRSGHLLQGRYDAQVVSGDAYLLRLSRYIHLNPVCTEYWDTKPLNEKVDFLRRYAWSSFRGYAGLTAAESWIDRTPTLNLIPARPGTSLEENYRIFVEAGLTDSDEELKLIMKHRSPAIGSPGFIESVQARQDEPEAGGALRQASTLKTPEDVMRMVRRAAGVTKNELRHRHIGTTARSTAAIALQKFCGLSQREIASHLGLTSSAAVSALISKKGKDETVKACLARVEAIIKDPG